MVTKGRTCLIAICLVLGSLKGMCLIMDDPGACDSTTDDPASYWGCTTGAGGTGTGGGTGGGGGSDACAACYADCLQTYLDNVDDCGGGLACQELYSAELHACEGECITDVC
jgi:hypothetical protein